MILLSLSLESFLKKIITLFKHLAVVNKNDIDVDSLVRKDLFKKALDNIFFLPRFEGFRPKNEIWI